jgi:hypothetical protein
MGLMLGGRPEVLQKKASRRAQLWGFPSQPPVRGGKTGAGLGEQSSLTIGKEQVEMIKMERQQASKYAWTIPCS